MLRVIAALFLAALPATAAEPDLYDRIANLEFVKTSYTTQRTAHGIDLVSREGVTLPTGAPHAKYHIEIEGPIPAGGLTSIQQVAEAVALSVKPEVDATQVQDNPIIPGVDVDFVDINGTVVAVLAYRANNEGNPWRQRIAILGGDGIYTTTMSLHTDDRKDRAGLAAIMLVVDMINSGKIPALQAASAAPARPIADGDYTFHHRFAEHPFIPSVDMQASIRAGRITITNPSPSAALPGGVIADGRLLWNAHASQWIIALFPADSEATEVGGCSDGPEVVDLEKRIYWTC
ncbi:hypothetical protein LF41_796 [Lysobacter dokdonensis DS-58]|uniref:Secreted protein n=1 Tax=Lysobacter dokdonensis DS-58 TaxID=1300345 RepID=A0A0A2WPQ0_9GAMM|nr:hypothetical protein [Lysobacter dokdonensis]KGQ20260.1 hypothetical protein LF41_796 [Lysobacter dokdonensis DS-58]